MIIVVSGLPGSGKSYFAEKLSQRLGLIHINSDQIRNTLNARGKYSFEDKLRVYNAMASRTSQSLNEGKSVIIDATFHLHAMVKIFIDLAKTHSSPIWFIKIEADESLIKSRLSKARKYSEAGYDVYLKLKEQSEELQVPYLTLQSENDSMDRMLELALDYIGVTHE